MGCIKKHLFNLTIVFALLLSIIVLVRLFFDDIKFKKDVSECPIELIGSISVNGNTPKELTKNELSKISGRNNHVVFNGHFSRDIPEYQNITMRLDNIVVNMYCNDILIYSFGSDSSIPDYINSAGNVWDYFSSPGIKTSDNIRIEITNVYNSHPAAYYNSFFYELHAGDNNQVLIKRLLDSFPIVLLAFIALTLALLLFIVAFAFKKEPELNRSLLTLAFTALFSSVWFLLDFDFINLVFPYPFANNALDIISLSFFILFTTINMTHIVTGVLKKMLRILEYFNLLFIILEAILQFFGVTDYYNFAHAIIMFVILDTTFIIVSLGYEYVYKKNSATHRIMMPIVILCFGALSDLMCITFGYTKKTHFIKFAFIIFILLQCYNLVSMIIDKLNLNHQREIDKERRHVSNETFHVVSKNSHTVVFIYDIEDKTVDAFFENIQTILGIAPEDFVKPYTILAEKFSINLWDKLHEYILSPRNESLVLESKYQKDESTSIWVKVSTSKAVIGLRNKLVISIYDFTKDKTMQEGLIIALESANNANVAKRRFLSQTSHDIRTPLNAIAGMANIARHSLNDKGELIHCISTIETSSNHLLKLINEVLDITKIEDGSFTLHQEPFVLDDLISDVTSILEPLIKPKEQTFEVNKYNVKHVNLIGDYLHINQVLINIISNSVKYTPDKGHISLNIYENIAFSANMANITFVVKDTGVGIAPEYINKIFRPFERSIHELSNIEGTGLGLSISKALIETMGGTITVISEVSKGSEFSIMIPLKVSYIAEALENTILPNDDEVNKPNNIFEGSRILIVDDKDINIYIASAILERQKAKTCSAKNGQIALDMFRSSEEGYYDLILMDIQMPVMNGYDATKAIRGCNHPQSQTIPIIAMTANAFYEDISECRLAGMNDHIAKPVDENIFHKVLKKYI